MSNHEHEHCGCGCEHHDHKPVADKYMTAINQSNVTIDDAAVAAAVQEIIDKHAAENNTPEVQQFLLNCVDLTTLATEDSERSVAQFVQKVNDFDNNYPQYKVPTRWTSCSTWATSRMRPTRNCVMKSPRSSKSWASVP